MEDHTVISSFLLLRPEAGLVVTRLIGDFDRTAPGLRKALNFKDALALHQAAGLFQHFLRILEQTAPSALFAESRDSLEAQFLQGFLDPDLCHCLTVQVPPGDIKSISAFRPGHAMILHGVFSCSFGFLYERSCRVCFSDCLWCFAVSPSFNVEPHEF